MILRLNLNGTITIEPQKVPEDLKSVYISYVYPKGLNHLRTVLTWGGQDYEGNDMYIKKTPTRFDMKVTLYNGQAIFKEYRAQLEPALYVGYNIKAIEPDIVEYIKKLEQEVKRLKEWGDVV
jgi:hypothetical protein